MGTMIKIAIAAAAPQPRRPMPKMPTKSKDAYHLSHIMEKVYEYICDIDSGMDDNRHQWEYIKAVFLKLHGKKSLTAIEKELMELVEPVIMKYCEYDPSLAAKIDGASLNKYTEKDND